MIEVRAYISNISLVRQSLLQAGGVVKGEYAFHDYIYHPKLSEKFDLNKEFIRIRAYQKTNWNQKAVELVHKIKAANKSISSPQMKKEYDRIEQAKELLSTNYIESLSFYRSGTELAYKKSRLFLEDIENLPPSLEIIAPSQVELEEIWNLVKPIKILEDSVPKLIEIL